MIPANAAPTILDVHLRAIAADVEKARIHANSQREYAWLTVDAERVRMFGDVLIRCDALRGMSSDQRIAVLSALLPTVPLYLQPLVDAYPDVVDVDEDMDKEFDQRPDAKRHRAEATL